MKKINLFLVLVLLCFCSSCFDTTTEGQTITITDVRDREVTLPKEVKRVVCIGASSLRLFSYFGDMSTLVGVEDFEKGEKMPVRPYRFAYLDTFLTLPSVGAGGPSSSPDAEAILNCHPDVIFSLYDNAQKMNQLQEQTKIPVVCLSYGGSDPFSSQVKTSLTLMGKILNKEERASFLVHYIETIQKDLNDRSEKDLDPSLKVYFGCNSYNGGKGSLLDTLVNYCCFREVKANNVVSSEVYPTNNPILDYETLVTLNPEIIFVDIANLGNLDAAYQTHKDVLMQVDAVKNQQIYVELPFNQYYTNLEIALADCYSVGKVLHKEAFKDIDLETKFNEICSTMLGKTLDYYDMTCSYYGRGYGTYQLSPLN
jgi:iron complex transport system substrate-binding protein